MIRVEAQNDLISLARLASDLQIIPRRIETLAKSLDISAHRINGMIFFDADAVEKIADAARQTSKGAA